MTDETTEVQEEAIQPVSMFDLADIKAEPIEEEEGDAKEEQKEESDSEDGEPATKTPEKAEGKKEEPKQEAKQAETKDDPKDKELIDLGDGVKETRKQIREILKSDKSIRARFGEVGRKEQQAKEMLEKAQQLDTKTKQDIAIIAEHLQGITDADPVGGLINTLDAFGADGRQVMRNVYKAIEKQVLERAQLSDAERQALESKEELDAAKAKLDNKTKSENLVKQQRETAAKILNAAKSKGLTEQEYNAAYAEVNDLFNKGYYKELANATVEQAAIKIIEHGVNKKAVSRIDGVLDSIDSQLKNNDNLVIELLNVIKSGIDVSDEDIAEIAKSITAEAKADKPAPAAKVNEKKQKTVEVIEETEEESTELKPVGFADLMNA